MHIAWDGTFSEHRVGQHAARGRTAVLVAWVKCRVNSNPPCVHGMIANEYNHVPM